jgi:hypothetical protein
MVVESFLQAESMQQATASISIEKDAGPVYDLRPHVPTTGKFFIGKQIAGEPILPRYTEEGFKARGVSFNAGDIVLIDTDPVSAAVVNTAVTALAIAMMGTDKNLGIDATDDRDGVPIEVFAGQRDDHR